MRNRRSHGAAGFFQFIVHNYDKAALRLDITVPLRGREGRRVKGELKNCMMVQDDVSEALSTSR